MSKTFFYLLQTNCFYQGIIFTRNVKNVFLAIFQDIKKVTKFKSSSLPRRQRYKINAKIRKN